jgi:hypothetical protein
VFEDICFGGEIAAKINNMATVVVVSADVAKAIDSGKCGLVGKNSGEFVGFKANFAGVNIMGGEASVDVNTAGLASEKSLGEVRAGSSLDRKLGDSILSEAFEGLGIFKIAKTVKRRGAILGMRTKAIKAIGGGNSWDAWGIPVFAYHIAGEKDGGTIAAENINHKHEAVTDTLKRQAGIMKTTIGARSG